MVAGRRMLGWFCVLVMQLVVANTSSAAATYISTTTPTTPKVTEAKFNVKDRVESKGPGSGKFWAGTVIGNKEINGLKWTVKFDDGSVHDVPAADLGYAQGWKSVKRIVGDQVYSKTWKQQGTITKIRGDYMYSVDFGNGVTRDFLKGNTFS